MKLIIGLIIISIGFISIGVLIYKQMGSFDKFSETELYVNYYIQASEFDYEIKNDDNGRYLNIIKDDTSISLNLTSILGSNFQIFLNNWQDIIKKDQHTTVVEPISTCKYLILTSKKSAMTPTFSNIVCSNNIDFATNKIQL